MSLRNSTDKPIVFSPQKRPSIRQRKPFENNTNNDIDIDYNNSKSKPQITAPKTNSESKALEKSMIESQVQENDQPTVLSGWRKDKPAISILMFLYVLQGIPLGLCGSLPYILTNRGISYKDQALFSFTFWPFSLKLIWAPIVDGLYSKKFGRRKSWLLPVQYFLGLMMIYLSFKVDTLIEGSITLLTAYFFLLNFGAATQDITVDGWCLTMLSKENVGWASTCNTVGQTAGYFLGNVVFLALESKDFSNNYLRKVAGLPEQDFGVATLPKFMFFWGVVFLIATTLVGIFKSEKTTSEGENGQENEIENLGVVDTYKILWKVLNKKMVKSYILFALTSRIGLCAVDNITGLKLIEKGVPKENMAMMAIPLTPISIVLPLIISKYTAGPRPLDVWVKSYPPRLIFGVCLAGLVYGSSVLGTASAGRTSGLDYPLWWYFAILFIYMLHQVIVNGTFVSIMAFNAKISDPEIGGTYMTLLNTVTNLGGNWPATVALYFVDRLSVFNCYEKATGRVAAFPENGESSSSSIISWDDKSLKDICLSSGENEFKTDRDGYFVEVAITTIVGAFWLLYFKKYIYKMDSIEKEEWYANKNGKKENKGD